MKKYKKFIIIAIIAILVLGVIGYVVFNFVIDTDTLSNKDKKWIEKNSSSVLSIAVPNDVPVFGEYGKGVFFDFTDYLANDLGLNINENTVSSKTATDGYRFEISHEYNPDSLFLYSDHYTVVGKSSGLLYDVSLISELQAGVLASELDYISEYFGISKDKFKAYETYAAITADLNNGVLNFAIVPLNEYKKELISNNINVLMHISDLKKYYSFVNKNDNTTIDSILTKQFNLWAKSKFNKSYNEHNYKTFIEILGINEAAEETLTNKVYKYGFAENRPYEVLSGGTYGGITSEYLSGFSEFADVEFSYKKYKTPIELVNAASNKEIDLYYNYYDLGAKYTDASGAKAINYYVIAHNSVDLSLANINGLANQTVYVLKDSYLYSMIKNIKNINVIAYEKTSELKGIISKKNIVLIDENTYEYYINKLTDAYSVRLKGTFEDAIYSFKYINNNDTFFTLFSAYAKTIDPNDVLRTGILTYSKSMSKSKILTAITTAIFVVFVICVSILVFYKRSFRRVKINTKVRKEDRIKYMDMLTSLKNRNYYTEKVDTWNKNTIYPQTCIVMDINKIKELNDSFGHEEGDKQILAVANILIRTQVDNSEIMRTDGNEFLVYMVGYSEKQVVSYMKKIMKEFKKLPYDYGVAMGFSMIEDDTKLVDDAFNEASNQMRENKQLYEDNDEK